MIKTDLADCTALELKELYRTHRASPLEATRAALARIERLNPVLHAFSQSPPKPRSKARVRAKRAGRAASPAARSTAYRHRSRISFSRAACRP